MSCRTWIHSTFICCYECISVLSYHIHMLLWMYQCAVIPHSYVAMNVSVCCHATFICCYECISVLSYHIHMLLWMYQCAVIPHSYVAMNVSVCCHTTFICCMSFRTWTLLYMMWLFELEIWDKRASYHIYQCAVIAHSYVACHVARGLFGTWCSCLN